MIEKEKVLSGLHCRGQDLMIDPPACDGCMYHVQFANRMGCDFRQLCRDAIDLVQEQESLLGIQQTADSITFISTGTAQQGEARGLLLGKMAMHEWLEKELLYRGLLTDDIRAVFDEAKRQ